MDRLTLLEGDRLLAQLALERRLVRSDDLARALSASAQPGDLGPLLVGRSMLGTSELAALLAVVAERIPGYAPAGFEEQPRVVAPVFARPSHDATIAMDATIAQDATIATEHPATRMGLPAIARVGSPSRGTHPTPLPEPARPERAKRVEGPLPGTIAADATLPGEVPSEQTIVVGGPPRASTPARLNSPATLAGNFGKFEIQGELGRGAMGTVYRALEPVLHRVVALKVLHGSHAASSAAVQRFQKEAMTAAKLNHPGIVRIHEVGVVGNNHYMAMDLVEGKSLSQLIGEKALPLDGYLRLLKRVAEAVDYAHRRGVIHRDLKPSNVLVDAQGNPYVSDFGLAREVASSTRLTLSGTTLGTPPYMPPEQALGETNRVDQRSDVYSLGAVLYEILTGSPPFTGGTPFDIIVRVISEAPEPPRKRFPEIPKPVETICLKAIEKDPAHRYQTAAALALDVERVLRGEAIQAKPVSILTRSARAVMRNRLVSVVSAVGVVALLAVGAWAIHKRAEIAREGEVVEKERRQREDEAERVRAEQQRRKAARKKADQLLAQAAAMRGETALEIATKAVEADPGYTEAYLARARILETLSRFDLLIADLSKAIELNPICVPAYLRRAWAYDDYLYDKEKAAADYFKVVELCPDNDIGYLARAKFNIVAKNYGEAEVDCNKAIQLNPNNAMAYATRAFSRWLSDQPKKALDDYKTALKMDPEAVRAYLTQTLLSLSGRKPSTALLEMTRGIQADPESHMAKIVNQAFVSALEEQWLVTLKCINQVVAENPEAYWGHLARGAAYMNARMYPMALVDFNWCIQKDPTLGEGWNLRAYVWYQQGKYAQAIPDYEKAIACEPTDETSHNMRGWCLTRLGRKDEARKEFDTSLAIAPRSPRVRIERGEFFEQTGDPQRALEEFGKATELSPADPRGYIKRAGVFLGLKRFPEAEAEFEKALALDPEDPRTWEGRARAYYDHGKHKEAIDDFTSCLKLAPNDVDVWNWRGCSHFAVGKYEESFEDFSEAWRRAPKVGLYASNAASALALGGKHARAIEMFDEAFRLNVNDANGYNWRAILWVREGKYANAARDALRMAELNRDPERRREAESLMRRSEAFEKTGKLPQVPRVE
ncbi:MAG: tetratricopeptide repeat protein [Planctomycetota bacterium]